MNRNIFENNLINQITLLDTNHTYLGEYLREQLGQHQDKINNEIKYSERDLDLSIKKIMFWSPRSIEIRTLQVMFKNIE